MMTWQKEVLIMGGAAYGFHEPNRKVKNSGKIIV